MASRRVRGRERTARRDTPSPLTPRAFPRIRRSGSPAEFLDVWRRRRPMAGRSQRAASDRVMAAWYGNSFTIDVNVTGRQPRQIAVYSADYDGGGPSAAARRGRRVDRRRAGHAERSPRSSAGQYRGVGRPGTRADPGDAPGRAERRRQRHADRWRRRRGRRAANGNERHVPRTDTVTQGSGRASMATAAIRSADDATSLSSISQAAVVWIQLVDVVLGVSGRSSSAAQHHRHG